MNKSYQIGLWILISVVPFLIFIQKLYGIVFMLLFGCLTILTMGIFYDLKRTKINIDRRSLKRGNRLRILLSFGSFFVPPSCSDMIKTLLGSVRRGDIIIPQKAANVKGFSPFFAIFSMFLKKSKKHTVFLNL